MVIRFILTMEPRYIFYWFECFINWVIEGFFFYFEIIPPHDTGIAKCIDENLLPKEESWHIEDVETNQLRTDPFDEIYQSYYSDLRNMCFHRFLLSNFEFSVSIYIKLYLIEESWTQKPHLNSLTRLCMAWATSFQLNRSNHLIWLHSFQ